MKNHRWTVYAVIFFGTLALGAKCPTIPKLEDRVVELALGASTVLQFTEDDGTLALDEQGAYNLETDIDLHDLLHDAGIDPSDVKDVKVAGVSYRVTVPQAGQVISNGNVTAARGASGDQQLVSNFSQDVSAVTGWITAPVSSAGVTLLNGLLADMLTAAQNHTSVVNPDVTYHITGTSSIPTNFTGQLKIDITIVGTFKEIEVLD